ncbi:hypothetical protein HDU76_004196 [Blyttiomyces sp. JEL0837]|nr:hypothetical protein HDU76_004196 [Blyttiomyces sp. JEL0837]
MSQPSPPPSDPPSPKPASKKDHIGGRKIAINDISSSFNYDPFTQPITTVQLSGLLFYILFPFVILSEIVTSHVYMIRNRRRRGQFIDNIVRTARYNVFDFFPKQLLVQFSKIGYLYFFFISMLQLVPGWSPTGQYTTIFPLVVFVGLAMLKEGWEDYQRHQNDLVENGLISRRLRIGGGASAGSGTGGGNNVSAGASSRAGLGGYASRTSIISGGGAAGSIHNLSRQTTGNREAYRHSQSQSKQPLVEWEEIAWKDIKVGDLVHIKQNEMIPADLLLLSTSNQNGSCFIETSNLDGESNLKLKQALPKTVEFVKDTQSLAKLTGTIHAESPSDELYRFEGYIDMNCPNGSKHPLNMMQLLPRGTTLANTDYVFGIVVYTGEETKIRRNASSSIRSKVPALEKLTNKIIFRVFIFLLVLAGLSTLFHALFTHYRFQSPDGKFSHWYLVGSEFDGVSTFFSFLILYNTMIPISLYVAMEFVKLVLSLFISNDVLMYDESSDKPAEVRTSNLHEDLGQVQYVFTDKTGTLTQNVMMFRKLSVGGVSYFHGTPDPAIVQKQQRSHSGAHNSTVVNDSPRESVETLVTNAPASTDALIHDIFFGENSFKRQQSIQLLIAMALCHTVTVEKKTYVGGLSNDSFHAVPAPASRLMSQLEGRAGGNSASFLGMATLGGNIPEVGLIYQSSSPDEIALVEAAKQMSFVLKGKTMSSVTLNIMMAPTDTTFTVLQTIEFSSHRRRMSVIYKYPDGRIVLLCKGADSVILERLQDPSVMTSEQIEVLDRTLKHLADFANEGLRTLLYAIRVLDPAEYEAWSHRYGQASLQMEKRSESLDRVAEEIEFDLTLLGATAIEDKLQTGVPETIEKLRRAGVKMWMLTGDKKETAINIGYTCQLAKDWSSLMVVDGVQLQDIERSIQAAYECFQSRDYCPYVGTKTRIQSAKKDDATKPVKKDDSAGSDLKPSEGSFSVKKPKVSVDERPPSRLLTIEDPRLPKYEGERAREVLQRKVSRSKPPSHENTTKSLPKSDCPPPETLIPETIRNDPKVLTTGLIQRLRGRASNKPHFIAIIEGDTLTKLEHQHTVVKSTYVVPTARTFGLAPKDSSNKRGDKGREMSVLEKFVRLGMICDGVICCRFSPSQKALIVSMVREILEEGQQNQDSLWQYLKQTINSRRSRMSQLQTGVSTIWNRTIHPRQESGVTLAIGDGANDIPMLQSAHVGVGITGREGLAASRASDYAIAQFRFLQPLMFIHGRYAYVRVSLFTLGTFYKCMTFYLTQAFFQLWTGWSGTSLYEQWTLALYNVLFTSLPVIAVGIFEKDLNKSTLFSVPELYRYGIYSRGFHTSIFGKWMVEGVWHSIVSVMIPFIMFNGLWNDNILDLTGGRAHGSSRQPKSDMLSNSIYGDMSTDFQETSLYALGTMVYTNVVLVANIKVCYMSCRNWTIFNHIAFALSILVWWIFIMVYPRMWPKFPLGEDAAGMEVVITSSIARMWLVQFLVVAVSIGLLDVMLSPSLWMWRAFSEFWLRLRPILSGPDSEHPNPDAIKHIILDRSILSKGFIERMLDLASFIGGGGANVVGNGLGGMNEVDNGYGRFAMLRDALCWGSTPRPDWQSSSTAAADFALKTCIDLGLERDGPGAQVAWWQLWESENHVPSDQIVHDVKGSMVPDIKMGAGSGIPGAFDAETKAPSFRDSTQTSRQPSRNNTLKMRTSGSNAKPDKTLLKHSVLSVDGGGLGGASQEFGGHEQQGGRDVELPLFRQSAIQIKVENGYQ